MAVADERPPAGRLIGWMFVVGAVLTTLLPLLPGVDGSVVTPTLAIGIAALVWGVVAVRAIRWADAPGWLIHLATVLGAFGIAVATHDTGGADSPARLLIMLVLVFAAYFFPAREAWPYLALVVALQELPLAYDRDAVSAGLLGELLVAAACYWLLAWLLIGGKRMLRELRERADALARTDALTGLPNRRALLEEVGLARPGEQLGMLLLDIDDFKSFNTSFGLHGGDRALVIVATYLREHCGAGRLPARIGGDEFAVLVREADADGMGELADGLVERFRDNDFLRVSAGWTLAAEDADSLLQHAGLALRDAKLAGKDRALSS